MNRSIPVDDSPEAIAAAARKLKRDLVTSALRQAHLDLERALAVLMDIGMVGGDTQRWVEQAILQAQTSHMWVRAANDVAWREFPL